MVKTFYEVILLSELPIEQVLEVLHKEFDAEIIPKGRSNRWTVIVQGVNSEPESSDGVAENASSPSQ